MKFFRRVRHEPSEKDVHKLRVAIRRFEAIVDLLEDLSDRETSRELSDSFHDLLKCLGPLRNSQVARDFIEDHLPRVPQSLIRYDRRRCKKARKKVLKGLDGFSVKKQKELIKIFSEKVRRKRNQESVRLSLGSRFRRTQLEFERIKRVHVRLAPDDIHILRITAKKVRYQGELLNTVAGHSEVNLLPLKKLQRSLGEIQDRVVVLKALDRYLEKHKRKHKIFQFRQELLGNFEKRLTRARAVF